MKRKNLINRLVARKMKSNGKRRTLCVCMARRLCWGESTPPSRRS
jgi:hypothetical protein